MLYELTRVPFRTRAQCAGTRSPAGRVQVDLPSASGSLRLFAESHKKLDAGVSPDLSPSHPASRIPKTRPASVLKHLIGKPSPLTALTSHTGTPDSHPLFGAWSAQNRTPRQPVCEISRDPTRPNRAHATYGHHAHGPRPVRLCAPLHSACPPSVNLI